MTFQGDLQDAYHHCDRIARQRARNFYPAFRFLPSSRRLALSTFYVFCSHSDDIADDESGASLEEKQNRLNAWEESLNRCFKGEADSFLFLALGDAITKYNLPISPFEDLLKGIRIDFTPARFSTFSELETYCKYVASSVGLISVRIFGCDTNAADEYAEKLGIGLQLTNIIRDISEDSHRGRLYIPLEDLHRFSLEEEDIHNQVYDDRFIALMEFQYERAQQYFNSADLEIIGDQSRKLLPAEIMKAVYRSTLEEIKRRNYRVYDGRVSLSKWRLIASAAKPVVKWLFRLI
ncbi:squalene synthase HpnD [candidate division LCP-89 bacterium B3_LCP]|uniref:Squalene synthase HpnD n=1 Tax=candidate division LCP-89 bacterium B3_LCP TaxID=2012998 RepID=A0A532UPX0_UNCL8|nr:MAG: squalene synthase HpnD [candidate division LCP-89 bacterium B3_LCP]